MGKVIEILKALSVETRIGIVWLFKKSKEALCVCEIMDSLGESQYNVSRHLRVLKDAGLVRENKEGRWVSYSLKEPENEFERLILEAISNLENDDLTSHFKRLKMRLALRKNGKCIVGMESKEWERQLSILLEEKVKNV